MNYPSFVIWGLMSLINVAHAEVAARWAIAVRTWHSCVTDGNSLYCWGLNSFGQLGSGKEGERIPTKIPLPANRLSS